MLFDHTILILLIAFVWLYTKKAIGKSKMYSEFRGMFSCHIIADEWNSAGIHYLLFMVKVLVHVTTNLVLVE